MQANADLQKVAREKVDAMRAERDALAAEVAAARGQLAMRQDDSEQVDIRYAQLSYTISTAYLSGLQPLCTASIETRARLCSDDCHQRSNEQVSMYEQSVCSWQQQSVRPSHVKLQGIITCQGPDQ